MEGNLGPADAPSREPLRRVLILHQGRSGQDADITRSMVDQARAHLRQEGLTPSDSGGVEIDLWLDTPGGDPDAAYKLMLVLRDYSCWIRAVVPDFAKSAATLVTLGADEIFMESGAELGPLDVQIPYEQEGMVTSALDVAHSFDHIAIRGIDLAIEHLSLVTHRSYLARQPTLDSLLDYAASVVEPIVSKLEPSAIHRSFHQLLIARDYAERLLQMRQTKQNIPHDLPRSLMVGYAHHGFVISLEEAKALGLPASGLDHYSFAEEVRLTHEKLSAEAGGLLMLDPTQLGVQEAGAEGNEKPDSGGGHERSGESSQAEQAGSELQQANGRTETTGTSQGFTAAGDQGPQP